MSIQTIKRIMSSNEGIIQSAKSHENPKMFFLKNFLYQVITFGFGKSLDIARRKDREQIARTVVTDIKRNLPEAYKLWDINHEPVVLHTDPKGGYQLVVENKALKFYTGEISKLNGKFNKDKNLGKSILGEEQFHKFMGRINTQFKGYEINSAAMRVTDGDVERYEFNGVQYALKKVSDNGKKTSTVKLGRGGNGIAYTQNNGSQERSVKKKPNNQTFTKEDAVYFNKMIECVNENRMEDRVVPPLIVGEKKHVTPLIKGKMANQFLKDNPEKNIPLKAIWQAAHDMCILQQKGFIMRDANWGNFLYDETTQTLKRFDLDMDVSKQVGKINKLSIQSAAKLFITKTAPQLARSEGLKLTGIIKPEYLDNKGQLNQTANKFINACIEDENSQSNYSGLFL